MNPAPAALAAHLPPPGAHAAFPPGTPSAATTGVGADLAAAAHCPALGRVLLVTAGVGGGHLRAAQAVERELRRGVECGLWSAESIQLIDVLDFAARPFRVAYRDGYLGLIRNAPALVGWLYKRSDVPWRGRGLRSVMNRLSLGRLRAHLRAERPDLIISTHFLSSEFVAWMRGRRELTARLATVVTDMDVHGLWFASPCDHFLVATDEAAEILAAAGMDRATIEVTGIPIDPRFEELPSKRVARAALELPLDRPVVLFASGGVGTGRLEEIFAQLLRVPPPVHLVAICGRNRRAERALRALLEAHRPPTGQSAQVIGFTERMHEWMAAADLLVGKPGGLTSSEARAAHLPMIIVDPVPGQEERNADHLLEWGVALRANTLRTLGWKVNRLLRNHDARVSMQRSAAAHARPASARSACEVLARAAVRETRTG